MALLLVGAGIVAAGTPARGLTASDAASVLSRVSPQVNPDTFPTITVSQDVTDFDPTIPGAGAQSLLLTLAENLEVENQALLRGDASMLDAVDHGDRLIEMQARVRDAVSSGIKVIARYQFESVNLKLIVPFGRQTGLSLGFDSRGTLTQETYDAAGNLTARTSSAFAQTFAIRRATGARWLNVAALPPGAGT